MPQTCPVDRFGDAFGYATRALDSPHDVMLTHPELFVRMLLEAGFSEERRARHHKL